MRSQTATDAVMSNTGRFPLQLRKNVWGSVGCCIRDNRTLWKFHKYCSGKFCCIRKSHGSLVRCGGIGCWQLHNETTITSNIFMLSYLWSYCPVWFCFYFWGFCPSLPFQIIYIWALEVHYFYQVSFTPELCLWNIYVSNCTLMLLTQISLFFSFFL